MTCSTVYGRCGDIDGVCPDPVNAQVMMTFCELAIALAVLAALVHYVTDLFSS
jgi:hypothetical protein